jgi:hypothetical protein
VNSAHLSSHGVLTTDGSLIFVRREVSGDRAELVIRARDGATSAWSDQSGLIPIYPVVGDDPSVVGCLLGSPQGIELVVLRAALSGPPKFLGLIGRRGIAGVGDPALAYQCVAAAQMPPPQFESKANTLVFFHAGLGRMVNFSVEKGELSLLPERSVAAVRSPLVADSGMFVTTPRGLVYSPDPAPPLPSESRSDGAPRPRPPEARLFDTPHVARATLNPDLPLILLGPVKDSPDPRIAVLVVWAAKE